MHVLFVIKFTTRTKANCSIHELHVTAAMLVHHYSIIGKNLLVCCMSWNFNGIANTSDVTFRYTRKTGVAALGTIPAYALRCHIPLLLPPPPPPRYISIYSTQKSCTTAPSNDHNHLLRHPPMHELKHTYTNRRQQ